VRRFVTGGGAVSTLVACLVAKDRRLLLLSSISPGSITTKNSVVQRVKLQSLTGDSSQST